MLAQLHAQWSPVAGDSTLSPPDEPDCGVCEDTGWALGDDGRAYQCAACGYWASLRQRHVDRVFAQAGIPAHFMTSTLDNWPGAEPARKAAVVWDYAPVKPSLLLHGPFGTGKTSLACALLRQRVERTACDALFITAPQLLDRIRETYSGRAEDAEAEVLQTVKDATLLVLDDLGAERVTDWVAEKLFTLVNHRHDWHRATIFTSNLDVRGLATHLGERTAWRIAEMAELVKVDGKNLRATP